MSEEKVKEIKDIVKEIKVPDEKKEKELPKKEIAPPEDVDKKPVSLMSKMKDVEDQLKIITETKKTK